MRIMAIMIRARADTIGAMLLIRLAISIFALTLLGLAFSLSTAQSQQNNRAAETGMLSVAALCP